MSGRLLLGCTITGTWLMMVLSSWGHILTSHQRLSLLPWRNKWSLVVVPWVLLVTAHGILRMNSIQICFVFCFPSRFSFLGNVCAIIILLNDMNLWFTVAHLDLMAIAQGLVIVKGTVQVLVDHQVNLVVRRVELLQIISLHLGWVNRLQALVPYYLKCVGYHCMFFMNFSCMVQISVINFLYLVYYCPKLDPCYWLIYTL